MKAPLVIEKEDAAVTPSTTEEVALYTTPAASPNAAPLEKIDKSLTPLNSPPDLLLAAQDQSQAQG